MTEHHYPELTDSDGFDIWSGYKEVAGCMVGQMCADLTGRIFWAGQYEFPGFYGYMGNVGHADEFDCTGVGPHMGEAHNE